MEHKSIGERATLLMQEHKPSSSFRFPELSSPSGVVPFSAAQKLEEIMPFEAILGEVEKLHGVGERLEGLAENHPNVVEELLAIAGNVRNVATILAVLVATKMTSKSI